MECTFEQWCETYLKFQLKIEKFLPSRDASSVSYQTCRQLKDKSIPMLAKNSSSIFEKIKYSQPELQITGFHKKECSLRVMNIEIGI